MIKIHPSSLGKIMTSAKGKGPEVLSVGAMTYCYERAKEFVYGYRPEISSKYLEKGLLVEDEAIQLYNLVNFTQYKKNTVRIENDCLTGECDIDGDDEIIDIKSAFSLATFPAISSRIDAKLYDWQGRAYMILYDKPKFKIAYCMISTPEHLCQYDDSTLHEVDHIDPSLRVTVREFERDEEKDKLIEIKCKAAQVQIDKFIEIITNEHS